MFFVLKRTPRRDAVRAWVGQCPGERWMDLGCGASAYLTRIVLDEDEEAFVAAVDVNEASARAAWRQLTENPGVPLDWSTRRFSSISCSRGPPPAYRHRWEVFHTASGRVEGIEFEPVKAILHEIFGFFASSEGAALALNRARALLLPTGTMLPARAASFFGPADVRATHLNSRSNLQLYATSKLILAKRLPFSRVLLSRQVCSLFLLIEFLSQFNR